MGRTKEAIGSSMDAQTQLNLEISKLAVAALVSLVVGAATIWISRAQKNIAASQRDIALEQRRVATAKLNLDLFDRRYELFMEVWGFLSHGSIGDVVEYSDPKFTNLIPKARFLFGDDIAEYMNKASSKKTQVALANKQKTSAPYGTPDADKQIYELGIWFNNEAKDCFKTFAPYLDFSQWRGEPARFQA